MPNPSFKRTGYCSAFNNCCGVRSWVLLIIYVVESRPPLNSVVMLPKEAVAWLLKGAGAWNRMKRLCGTYIVRITAFPAPAKMPGRGRSLTGFKWFGLSAHSAVAHGYRFADIRKIPASWVRAKRRSRPECCQPWHKSLCDMHQHSTSWDAMRYAALYEIIHGLTRCDDRRTAKRPVTRF